MSYTGCSSAVPAADLGRRDGAGAGAEVAIAELERQQGRAFSEKEKAVFRRRGEHRFEIPHGARWGDVKAASVNLGGILTKAMRAVANANDELRGVFTVDCYGW